MRPSPQAFKASPSISLLRFYYSPSYKFHEPTNISEIFRLSRANRHAARPRKGLWWSVTANTMQRKSVVRSWGQRRLRVAIQKALEARGWDRRGLVVRKGDDGQAKKGQNVAKSKGNAEAKGDLKGTLQVYALEKVLQATGEDVRREAEALVKIVGRKVNNLREVTASKAKH